MGPQIQSRRTVTAESVDTGVFLILKGLLKKVVFADTLGVVVDALSGDVATAAPRAAHVMPIFVVAPLNRAVVHMTDTALARWERDDVRRAVGASTTEWIVTTDQFHPDDFKDGAHLKTKEVRRMGQYIGDRVLRLLEHSNTNS